MQVIYVEKKSVASSIARALGAKSFTKVKDLTKKKLGILGYWVFDWNKVTTYIIYGVGHLTGLFDAKDYDSKYAEWNLEHFPCCPNRIQTKPFQHTIDFYNLAEKLFKEAELIISATDSDREGQVVFDYLYKTIGVKTRWKRAWLPSDLTSAKIRYAFENLEDWSVRYPLTLAGITRSLSDWIIGCNLTVAATIKYGGSTVMNVGRVQTAVLNLVVERTREIEKFKPELFWKVVAQCNSSDGLKFTADLLTPNRFINEEDALAIVQMCNEDGFGIISNFQSKKRTLKKPPLFSTSELQIEANRLFGYDVTKIASVMEELYNNHYISYPRTEANVISTALESEVEKIIEKLMCKQEYSQYNREKKSWCNFTSRHFNDALIAKTGDSHTAIIPTLSVPDISLLTKEQRDIYNLIALSVLSIVYDDVDVTDTKATIMINNHEFVSKGSVINNYEASWYYVLNKKVDNAIPKMNIGEKIQISCSSQKGVTKPQPFYTQASLLNQMIFVNKIIDDSDIAEFMKTKECGLGTGGTRPQIVGGLIQHQLIKKDKGHLIPTEKGYWLIDHIPNELKMIKEAKTTGQWEQRLNLIATSDLQKSRELSIKFIQTVTMACDKYFKIIKESSNDFFTESYEGRKMDEDVLICPKCSSQLKKFDWGYGCSGYKNGCSFNIGKFRGKKLSDKQIADLLNKGKTNKITFQKKSGEKYQGFLIINKEGEILFSFK